MPMDVGLMILLADANVGDANLIRSYVDAESPGATVVHVTNLADTCREIQDGDYDVVLLELDLDDSKGLATAEILCTFVEDRQQRPPVVVVSRFEDRETIDAVIDRCADDFLLKRELDARCLMHGIRVAVQRHSRSVGSRADTALTDSLDAVRRLNRSGINPQAVDQPATCGANVPGCPVQDIRFYLAHFATNDRAMEIALGELTGQVKSFAAEQRRHTQWIEDMRKETILNTSFRQSLEHSPARRVIIGMTIGTFLIPLLLGLIGAVGGAVLLRVIGSH